MSINILGPALLAAAVLALSLALPFAVRPLLVKLGIMDVPSARSSHSRPVLRGLGLAVLLAWAVGGAVAAWWLFAAADEAAPAFTLVLVGSVLAGLLGLAEDLQGVSVLARSVFLLLVSAVLVFGAIFLARPADGAIRLGYAFNAATPPLGLLTVAVLAVYGVLFISGFINVANFMDGLNGISGFHGVIAGLGFAYAGLATEREWLLFAGLLLAAAFAGFLPWNFSRRGAFLGDVGSYLLGGCVAGISFAALINGVAFLATIGPMVIYFGDVAVTLVRRVRRGERWDEPHKEHVYQRIQQLGYSHAFASGITALASAITTLLGLASIFATPLLALLLLAAGVLVLFCYLAVPRLLGAKSSE